MTLTEEQRGTVAFDLEKARAVDIDLLAASTTIFSGAQATRIKELEKMVYSAIGQIAWSLSIETGRMPDKMSIDFLDWQVPPEVKKTWTDWAALHLQSEGKIGPDAKPRSWQITEERVGLLRYCLDSLLDAPDIEESPGPRHSIEMLRTMLTEAE